MYKSIQTIADEIGTSKQNVNQMLKRGMRKMYKTARKKFGAEETPFETAVTLAKMLKINKFKDLEHFFYDFPDDIRKEILISGNDKMNINNFNVNDFLSKTYVEKSINF